MIKQQGIIDTCAKFGYKYRSIRPTTHLRIGDLTYTHGSNGQNEIGFYHRVSVYSLTCTMFS